VPAERPRLPSPRMAAIYVTPAHQHPLGYVLSSAHRHALVADARATATIIVEDDYDSEFRYEVAPIPALASLDRSVVAYLGTAAKAVSPSLRLGWMVPPPALLDPIIRHRQLTHDRPSWPAQRALLTLLRDGWVDQVVRSARRTYRERAPRVAAALAPYGQLAAPLAGMYGTWLLPGPSAIHARDHARVAGFQPFLLDYYCRSATPTGLVIGFGD
jgi:GntR family transcriptional regulator/MocR family aminotransferase